MGIVHRLARVRFSRNRNRSFWARLRPPSPRNLVQKRKCAPSVVARILQQRPPPHGAGAGDLRPVCNVRRLYVGQDYGRGYVYTLFVANGLSPLARATLNLTDRNTPGDELGAVSPTLS